MVEASKSDSKKRASSAICSSSFDYSYQQEFTEGFQTIQNMLFYVEWQH